MRAAMAGILVLGGTALSAAPLSAQEIAYACARGDYVRTVSVVSEPDSDLACEVRYQKTSEGGQSEVLWNARNDESYCRKQAEKLTARLTEAGWSCGANMTAATAKADPLSNPIADVVPEPLAVAVAPGGEGVTGAVRRGAVPEGTQIKRVAPQTAPAKPHRGTIDPNDPALDGRSPVDPTELLRPAQQ